VTPRQSLSSTLNAIAAISVAVLTALTSRGGSPAAGGVLAAMETSYVPTIALVHSAPGALAPPGGPIDRFVIGEVNRIRFALDLTPVDSFWQAWQQHDVICASIPELEPLGTDTLHPVAWIGPVFEDLTTIDWMPDDHDDTPLVLVSFNSERAWDQTSRIQGTIDGLAGADLRVIVTAGSVDPSRLHVPTKSIEIVKYVPHAAILPWASAVVTHAGHGTLTAALAHGLPIVAIPNEAADQPALARTDRTPRRRYPPPRGRRHCDRNRLRNPNRARRLHLRRQRPGPRRPHPHLQQSATCSR
jgi:hypothetical protein